MTGGGTVQCYRCELDPNGVPNWEITNLDGSPLDPSTICDTNADGSFGKVQGSYHDLNGCKPDKGEWVYGTKATTWSEEWYGDVAGKMCKGEVGLRYKISTNGCGGQRPQETVNGTKVCDCPAGYSETDPGCKYTATTTSPSGLTCYQCESCILIQSTCKEPTNTVCENEEFKQTCDGKLSITGTSCTGEINSVGTKLCCKEGDCTTGGGGPAPSPGDLCIGTQQVVFCNPTSDSSPSCQPTQKVITGTKTGPGCCVYGDWTGDLDPSQICAGSTGMKTRYDIHGACLPETQLVPGSHQPVWSDWIPNGDPSKLCPNETLSAYKYDTAGAICNQQTGTVPGTKVCDCPSGYSETDPGCKYTATTTSPSGLTCYQCETCEYSQSDCTPLASTVCEGEDIAQTCNGKLSITFGSCTESNNGVGTKDCCKYGPWTGDTAADICYGDVGTRTKNPAPGNTNPNCLPVTEPVIGSASPNWGPWEGDETGDLCEGEIGSKTRYDSSPCNLVETVPVPGTRDCDCIYDPQWTGDDPLDICPGTTGIRTKFLFSGPSTCDPTITDTFDGQKQLCNDNWTPDAACECDYFPQTASGPDCCENNRIQSPGCTNCLDCIALGIDGYSCQDCSSTANCCSCPSNLYPENLWVPDPACYCGPVSQTNEGENPDCCPISRTVQGECTDCGPSWDGCQCWGDHHCITCYGPDPQCE